MAALETFGDSAQHQRCLAYDVLASLSELLIIHIIVFRRWGALFDSAAACSVVALRWTTSESGLIGAHPYRRSATWGAPTVRYMSGI